MVVSVVENQQLSTRNAVHLHLEDIREEDEPAKVEKENLIEVNYEELVKSLRISGQILRSDLKQPNILEKPSWFDEKLFKNAQLVFTNHRMGINFAHLSGLLLLIRVNSIYNTLSKTGESSSVSRLFKRYYHTISHVKSWYEGDIFEEHSDAYRSLLIVRGMHNKVSSKFNQPSNKRIITNPETNNNVNSHAKESETLMGDSRAICPYSHSATNAVHISQYDIMLTQFAFVGFIVTHPNKMGLISNFSQRDMDSLLHFWRVIGYYLGVSEKYNLCSYDFETTKQLCKAMMKLEYGESLFKNPLNNSEPGIMSINIVRSLKFIPMLTVYGIMRYLYELFEHPTQELEIRVGWYSNLSYNLTKLVLTNLLGYRYLRTFNNALIRLSLYTIGKFEDRFSDYLDSKYGQELKI